MKKAPALSRGYSIEREWACRPADDKSTFRPVYPPRNVASVVRENEFRSSASLSHGEKPLPTVRRHLSRAAGPPPSGAYRILAACRTCRHHEAC